MIDIKDLQIGNKVLYQNKVVEIATTHTMGMVGIFDGNKDFIVPISCNDIEPILITPYKLNKIGFTRGFKEAYIPSDDYEKFVNNCFASVRNGESNSIGRDWYCHIDNDRYESIGGFDFQYLHELQNGIRLITKGDLEANL